jgi:hypothetical protein
MVVGGVEVGGMGDLEERGQKIDVRRKTIK